MTIAPKSSSARTVFRTTRPRRDTTSTLPPLPDQLAQLGPMLRRVNAECRDLAGQILCETKLSRVARLRLQRVALIACIFISEQQKKIGHKKGSRAKRLRVVQTR